MPIDDNSTLSGKSFSSSVNYFRKLGKGFGRSSLNRPAVLPMTVPKAFRSTTAMRTALTCLAAGFVLAHASSFILARAGSSIGHIPQGTALVATSAATPIASQSAAPTNVAFAQYEVASATTVTLPEGSVTQPDIAALRAMAAGVPAATSASTLSRPNPLIAGDVDKGVANMNAAIKTMPVALARMTDSVSQHGVIAALAYDDPAVKSQTDLLAAQLGASLRGFADAIGKDMQRSIRESGISAQPTSR